MNQIKVFLADDHALIRAGYRLILQEYDNIELIGEAGDGEEAMEMLKTLAPDVVVLDITMPKKNGLEAAKEIKEKYPDIKVLILSMHKEEAYVVQSIINGADGYLVKDTDSETFIEAILTLYNGEKYYGEFSSKVLINNYIVQLKNNLNEENGPNLNLSKREKQVLEQVVKGLSNREISERLFLSIRTVDNHKANLMKKLQVHSTFDLIQTANRYKLIG